MVHHCPKTDVTRFQQDEARASSEHIKHFFGLIFSKTSLGSVRSSNTNISDTTTVNGTRSFTDVLSQPDDKGGASTAQVGIGVEAPFDNVAVTRG